jgi:hypothetical protein
MLITYIYGCRIGYVKREKKREIFGMKNVDKQI